MPPMTHPESMYPCVASRMHLLRDEGSFKLTSCSYYCTTVSPSASTPPRNISQEELDFVKDPMDVDLEDEGQGAGSDSSLSTSLPEYFFQSRIDSLRSRRVSISAYSTPLPHKNPLPLLEGARDVPAATKRFFMMSKDGIDDGFDDEGALSTPSKSRGYYRPFARSSSLLTRMHESGSLLGKHPQTPSPGEGPRSKSKGLRCPPVMGMAKTYILE